MYTQKRRRSILSAVLMVIMGPGYALASNWSIQTPADQESFGSRTSSIGGEGGGPSNTAFVFRIRQGGALMASVGGTVSSYEEWAETIPPPGSGYNCGAATAEIVEDSTVRDTVSITFSDSGCG